MPILADALEEGGLHERRQHLPLRTAAGPGCMCGDAGGGFGHRKELKFDFWRMLWQKCVFLMNLNGEEVVDGPDLMASHVLYAIGSLG